MTVTQVMIGADSKAVKRVLDGVSKAAPGLSFMGFSAEGPGASGKLIVFSAVAGTAAEVIKTGFSSHTKYVCAWFFNPSAER